MQLLNLCTAEDRVSLDLAKQGGHHSDLATNIKDECCASPVAVRYLYDFA